MSDPRTILTVDIGNTATKTSVFEGERLVQSVVTPGCAARAVETMFALHSVDGIAYCCVGADPEGIGDRLEREAEVPVLRLTHSTPLPIGIRYSTQGTLGLDRVAAAAGVDSVSSPVLLVDAGTAVTLDLVADNEFLGGNISPGLRLRCESLHAFTSALPLVDCRGDLPERGYDTPTAIRAGVVRGLAYEIIGALESARAIYPDVRPVIAGGDAPILVPLLGQLGVCAESFPSAVGVGLVRIFNHNNPELHCNE